MDFFFNPRGIAVIGATPNPQKGGNNILQNLILGYRGGIYPVNPNYSTIDGLICHPSASAIPDPVDLAIVFVPAPLVPAAVEDCAAKGVRGVIIESGGFAETGPNGKKLQQALKEIAARTGIRLWGPNCMGLVDVVHSRIFSFMDPRVQRESELIPGTVSLVVQSGMLSAIFLVDLMSHATMGVSKACSLGNKVDVNECDILEYLLADPDTQVIGLYLESFADGRRFLNLCRRSDKPIVVLKGGRSQKGAEAALSHTASLAGNQRIVEGVLAQAGATISYDFKEMMDICRSLALAPPPPANRQEQGKRVAVLSPSGGSGIVATDFIAEEGLAMATLTPETLDALGEFFPDWMPVANPVDLWPAIEKSGDIGVFGRAFEIVLADPGVDALFFHVFISRSHSGVDIADLSARIRAAGKPAVAWTLGRREDLHAFQKEALASGIPVFAEISRAAKCLAAILAERQRRGEIPAKEKMDPSLQRVLDSASRPLQKGLPAQVATSLNSAPQGPLDEQLSKMILSACGIPTIREEGVSDPAQAEAAAAAIGYPVVMKGLLPQGVHKTELGLVQLGILTPESVRTTFEDLMGKMEGQGQVLIQKQFSGKVELILGYLRDPQFGPCVMLGAGGVMAELFDDAVFAVAPLTHAEAMALIGRIRGQKMLDGFRGAPPVEREAIARLLVALGEIGLAFPRICEIDINPLICGAEGAIAVDATVILG